MISLLSHRSYGGSVAALVILCCTWAAPAFAINYDVEVIIFEHVRNTSVGSSDNLLLPVIRDARTIPEGADPGQPTQPLPELRLQAEADKIRQSDGYRLLYHGGWRQPDYDQETAPYMRIALGQPVEMFVERGTPDSLYLTGYDIPPADLDTPVNQARSATLYGGIKVWVGRFLHFDTLLSYTPRGSTQSFAMQQDRRMRSRQLHYLDNPRIGIITKIFPVDETAAN
ncbi:MAG: CsiV family protein [Pseudomonadota bacterium]